jgi:hypothetical protein
MHANIEIIKNQIRIHRNFLARFLETFHPEILVRDQMKFTEVMYYPEGGEKELEYLELWNYSGAAIQIGSWRIAEGVEFEFPPSVIAPADSVVVVAADPEAFRRRYPEFDAERLFGPYTGDLSNSGEVLRLLDGGPDHPATVDLLRYGVGGDWPALKEGHSIVLGEENLALDNDLGGHWRISTTLGGDPGRSDSRVRFLRGEVNGDGTVNLGDAIAILTFMFIGGVEVPCQDAADVDDNGRLLINDPLQLLTFLFLDANQRPAPPFPRPGVDPTGNDDLECLAILSELPQ